MPDRLSACEGAASILGLCPHMQNPRLRRGIIIEKVTVFDEKIAVMFKSGVEIDVEK